MFIFQATPSSRSKPSRPPSYLLAVLADSGENRLGDRELVDYELELVDYVDYGFERNQIRFPFPQEAWHVPTTTVADDFCSYPHSSDVKQTLSNEEL